MRPLLSQRGALQVVKAEDGEAAPKEKKEPKKLPPRMDSAVKRAKIAEDRRMTNKAFKSAVATRVKKASGCALRGRRPRSASAAVSLTTRCRS